MKDKRPRAPWSEGSRIGANLRNCLKNAEDQSFVCCLFVGRAVVRVSVRCPVESARRLWRVRLCSCSDFSWYVHCARRWSAGAPLHAPDEKVHASFHSPLLRLRES